jgi:hypothetical protein
VWEDSVGGVRQLVWETILKELASACTHVVDIQLQHMIITVLFVVVHEDALEA